MLLKVVGVDGGATACRLESRAMVVKSIVALDGWVAKGFVLALEAWTATVALGWRVLQWFSGGVSISRVAQLGAEVGYT